MRIGIIGYGAVAAVHAKGLLRWGADLRVVCGPNAEKAAAFASGNGIPKATSDPDSVFAECDAVIVASPSELHFEQALGVLQSGRHCLVELPACRSAREAEELRCAALAAKVVVQCAHTTRYLPGILRLQDWLRQRGPGEILHVESSRVIPPRRRSWIDDAVLHHAAHHVDLLLHWFGRLEAVACVAHPGLLRSQDAVLLGRLENGAPVSIGVSYTARIRETRLTIAGRDHTVRTDGFSFIESDDPGLLWRGDEDQTYEAAVEAQDRSFLQAAAGGQGGCRGRIHSGWRSVSIDFSPWEAEREDASTIGAVSPFLRTGEVARGYPRPRAGSLKWVRPMLTVKFFRNALAIAALCAAALPVSAADLRLGIIGTDVSHVIHFSRLLNKPGEADHIEGARIVAAYKGGSPDVESSRTRVDGYAADLAKTYGVEIVPDIPTLCSKVDGVLLESGDGRIHLEQAKLVFAAHKPVFIDKPLASTLEDAREIARLAKAAGVAWFSSSGLRFNELGTKYKYPDATGIEVWGPGPMEEHRHLDLSWYAIHPIETLYTLMGMGCEEVTRISGGDFKSGSDVVVGRWKDGRIGSVRTLRPSGGYGVVVFRPKAIVQSPPNPPFSYALLCRQIVDFFQTGRPPVPNEETLEIYAFMDAAQRSKEAAGKPMRLR